VIRTYLIPLLAIAGLAAGIYTVVRSGAPKDATPPVVSPPTAPYPAFVAGSGLIEPSSQPIAIGSPVGALVDRVATVGQAVAAGDVLFTLDTTTTAAELASRDAAVAVAQSQLDRLLAGTRPELIPPARARIAEMEAALADQQAQLALWENITDERAVSRDDLSKRRFAVQTALARLDAARADLALLESGTWAPDISVARAALAQATAQRDAAAAEHARRTVRAPISGRVLQVNVRPGEFAPAGTLQTPLIVMGNVDPLHVRVDVDEYEAWRVRPGSPATAFARGNREISTPLEFVRFEPLIVPKRSLTGESAERVDTRVLQVIYRFQPGSLSLYVGQQVDVFIKAEPRPDPKITTAPQEKSAS
jgi:HlyD family secretion protein